MLLRTSLVATMAMLSFPALGTPSILPPEVQWQDQRKGDVHHDEWDTSTESSGFQSSPTYTAAIDFLSRLSKASPLISLHRFGETSQGRGIFYAKASKGGSPRPTVLIQAGIHAGEIDGLDAGLMLLRDIAVRGRADLLDAVDVVFIPVLNVDGHAAASPLGRPSQRGPAQKGTRTNSQGLDLNRDYARIESPEARAVVGLLHQLDPALYIDVHASDGTDYQYDVTWAFAGWGTYARSRSTADWLMSAYSRDIKDALVAAGNVPAVYPSWVNEDSPSQGLRISVESPRYSTGYGDFIGVPTVLIENHRFKGYRQRVLGTYAFMEQSLRTVSRDASAIEQAKVADRAMRPPNIAVRWERDPVPLEYREFQTYRYDDYISSASGARELLWTGQSEVQRLPVFGTRVTESAPLPIAWLIPPGNQNIVDLLHTHHIITEPVPGDRTTRVELVRMANGLQRTGFNRSQAIVQLPAGTLRVPTDQPLRLLAAALLEPSSQDSILAMGWYDRALPAESPLPRHLLAPLADEMMKSNADLRAEFEVTLASNPAFAADPQARLRWWEVRSAYGERTFWTYPVLSQREL
ncbi:M14 family metallopeptidase [Stenotrophomonas sp. S41]|uniref:M14 family metallopeptidase n=1 Tax=Stenotrophomonas sp. S41 TaxID=2767464 RepID=UPI00190A4BB1|nr:M14 family metallopeptidase [Stenotrophomonas sp. S41]MBK0010793.1 M14 family metallopeptidase [Stenotrophomonas sp. S41]